MRRRNGIETELEKEKERNRRHSRNGKRDKGLDEIMFITADTPADSDLATFRVVCLWRTRERASVCVGKDVSFGDIK